MRENLREKRKLIRARVSNPETAQIDSFPQVKYTCVDLGGEGAGAKSSNFKKLGKHCLGSLDLKRECGLSRNARELTGEKKVDMGENLSPHEGTQMTFIVSISSRCFYF